MKKTKDNQILELEHRVGMLEHFLKVLLKERDDKISMFEYRLSSKVYVDQVMVKVSKDMQEKYPELELKFDIE